MPVSKCYEQLQFIHDAISNNETFSQRLFFNVESEVVEGEGKGNVFITHEVTPREKKRKV